MTGREMPCSPLRPSGRPGKSLGKSPEKIPGRNQEASRWSERRTWSTEVDQNYTEMVRLLSLLGAEVRFRFVRGIETRDIGLLGGGTMNILRETGLSPVGEALETRYGTPYIPSFPIGLEGTLAFLEQVAGLSGIPAKTALDREKSRQRTLIDEFADIRGRSVQL